MRHSHIAALVCALLSFSQGSAIAHAEPVPAQIAVHPHGAFIAEAARRFGIPAPWIVAVMRQESGGRTMLGEGTPIVSRAGAIGLMQVLPGTYVEMAVQHKLGDNPFEPRDNIMAGTAYLRWLHHKYGYPAMFAAYNAGPGRLEDHLKEIRVDIFHKHLHRQRHFTTRINHVWVE